MLHVSAKKSLVAMMHYAGSNFFRKKNHVINGVMPGHNLIYHTHHRIISSIGYSKKWNILMIGNYGDYSKKNSSSDMGTLMPFIIVLSSEQLTTNIIQLNGIYDQLQ